MGALDRTYLRSHWTLQEARVLWEIANHPGTRAKDIITNTGLEQGYLSRILARLQAAGTISTAPDPDDRRARLLHLTPAGQQAFRELDERAARQANTLLAPLDGDGQHRLSEAMATTRHLLGDAPSVARIRQARPGDAGWLVMRQAELYHREFGYDAIFEAYVAKGLAPFLQHFLTARATAYGSPNQTAHA